MQFDFGENWINFSKKSLTAEKIQQAEDDFEKLFNGIELQGKTFVDIGFGQGLSLIFASQKGTVCIGCDINPKCDEALKQTLAHFPQLNQVNIPIIYGSILDGDIIEQLQELSKNQGFDVVHSWGVLCLTGSMQKSIQNTASLVKPGGYLAISIYNRHWTSPIWLAVKWLYCKSPKLFQKAMIYFFYPIIWLAKYLVTRENPKKMTRGMDFFYNVIDWVGGYPYEYASKGEIIHLIEPLGFELIHFVPAQVPTGCNEFIWKKIE